MILSEGSLVVRCMHFYAITSQRPMSSEPADVQPDGYTPKPIPANRNELEPIPLPPELNFSSGTDEATSKYDAATANLEPGYTKYCAIRDIWVGQGTRQPRPNRVVDVDAVCECLANNRPNPFKHPIPLSEMVSILVELWEDDGLYD